MLKKAAFFFLCIAASAMPAAWAGNGHMLHGFGPVNSSMGGAGAGLWEDPVAALMFNPALLASSEGNEITFATEFFKDGIQIQVTLDPNVVPGGNGNRSGTTHPSNQVGVLPSFGWSIRKPGSKWAFGFGLVAIAGFRTDYPENPDSIVFDLPPNGFGRIYTDYRNTRIPLAVAYQATPKLALGFSLNTYVAELAIAPLPADVFDVGPGEPPLSGDRFYPSGGNLVNEFAFSGQLGFLYTATPKISIGGSVTTAQNFDRFTWNSTIAHPDLPNFGAHRRLSYDLDGPLSATLGTGIKVNPKTSVAFDVMWIKYDGVHGFGDAGGIRNRIVVPFGWRNVWAYKAGLEYEAGGNWTLRAGYNYSNMPLQGQFVLTITGAVATFEHHYCAGVGFKITNKVSADLAVYHVPRSHVIGPYPDLDNNRLGTLNTSNKLDSVLVGLNWKF